MGIKVKGISQAKKNLNDIISDVRGRRVVRGIQSGLILIGSRAAYYTPIDTSTLINSQFREIDAGGVIITGRIGYSANYVVYVHEASGKLKGQPRAHFGTTRAGKQFGGGTEKGNYWDPHGEPQFLTKGVNDERDNLDAVMLKELSL
ncbi:HK97 gp10 family phage protein [Citrobacter amalonaticus]|uniref:HK97 gp10 family phage protein n=1 Tax=Citrobacter amalonaticus TaxID=35703 RepID=UPI00188D5B38|nr:HK97 gp10 family phage protein [Citrobacter amalonaticus]QPB31002.1 HK97 gp10 family phage protein [Citrobacter amalonaticus]